MEKLKLRHRADLRSLSVMGLYFILTVTFWQLDFLQLPIGLIAACVATLAVISWLCAVITHNTLHQPMFSWRPLNRLIQVLLTMCYGFPVSEYLPGHNLSHHRYMQSRRDVMRTTKVATSWNLLNFILFFPKVAIAVTAANFEYARRTKSQSPAWYRQLLLEASFGWGVKAVGLALDWKKAILLIFVPHLFAVWGITSVNYLQHDGCDPEHPVNHSRNFTGRLFNWITFNNGFHGMHHVEPGLHWSLLAIEHYKRLAPTLHPALDQRSLAVYFWNAFVYPGKRVRYDGKPFVLPAEGPDEDWIGRGREGLKAATEILPPEVYSS